jgi:hypothetical protein
MILASRVADPRAHDLPMGGGIRFDGLEDGVYFRPFFRLEPFGMSQLIGDIAKRIGQRAFDVNDMGGVFSDYCR